MTGDYSSKYDPDLDFDRFYTEAAARRIAKWLHKGNWILELGSATSLMTSLLAGPDYHFDAVERSSAYIERARERRLPNVELHRSTLEAFETERRYDHVLMTGLLPDLLAPRATVAKVAAAFLKPGGKLHVTTPNPDSIHRKVAVIAGDLQDGKAQSERGKHLLVVALYTNAEVKEMGAQAGLRLILQDGILFKPLTNAGMAALDRKYVDAFDVLAHEFPDHSGMTYFVFEK